MYKYEEKDLILVEQKEVEFDKECEEVYLEELEDIKKLGQDMINFCVENGGVGLAAPQIGINKKMFVWMNGNDSFQIILNPKYHKTDKKTSNLIEGCLSYPDMNFFVQRSKYINAMFDMYNEKKNEFKRVYRKLSGEKAYIFQHETDHVYGITINMIGEEFNLNE